MISLNGTTEKIQIVPGTAGSIDAQADYVDLSGTTVTPGSNQINDSAATSATDLVGSPAASTSRRVKYLGIRNISTTVTTTMLVQKIATGPLTIELIKVTLLPGWLLVYNGATWFVYDNNGAVVTGPMAGRFLRSTTLVSGTSFSTGVDTESIRVRLFGGGGAGGGAATVAAGGGAGGGGSAGGYAEKTFDVIPNTAYTYAIGAAGAPGAAGANAGGAGGNSTFTVGGTTVTAFGGPGGTGMASGTAVLAALGGAPAPISTNGDVNGSGMPGNPGIRLSGTVGVSGAGGDCGTFGAGDAGRITQGAGAAGIGRGAGGSGGLTLNAGAATAGGAGTAGMIIVEEYT